MNRWTSAVRFVVAILTALAVVACSDPPVGSDPPAAPSPLRQPFEIKGYVLNMADRPIADVKVEVVDGPGLGAFGVTDAFGYFALSTVHSDPIVVRLSKDGYVTRTNTYRGPFDPRGFGAYFWMELSGPSVNMAGDYTLTFTADGACTQLPVAARTRTYQAAITPRRESQNQESPNRYDVVLSGASFLRGSASFFLAVIGSSARFQFDSEYPYSGLDPYIVEELAPTTYVTIEGETDTAVDGSTISASFRGYFQYCTGTTDPLHCAEPVACGSSDHRLTLTRR